MKKADPTLQAASKPKSNFVKWLRDKNGTPTADGSNYNQNQSCSRDGEHTEVHLEPEPGSESESTFCTRRSLRPRPKGKGISGSRALTSRLHFVSYLPFIYF